ncbi:hypothetical protein NA56DRAFT_698375 [Hyaloscypha hepaticicola]|uniref:Uncharacterized protein n=1 Tax=Hyaloscypha hepaticicola TaxID=2082293 RepID=A0A2J6QIW8_9HELO|nr:hypothetical protein NA56DRAFT_698375 [Hyaloscypha hepaticicola]
MIAVAAAIVAQIAITGLSLNFLSQTHWVARVCFVLSLTFALMAVYYSTTQQRTLGRLLKAKGVRLWIRGVNRRSPTGRIIPTLDDLVKKLPFPEIHDRLTQGSAQFHVTALIQNSWFTSSLLHGFSAFIYATTFDFDFLSSDPDDYTPNLSNIEDIKSDIIYHCFTPSVASVLTISAPQMMLTASLGMLLIGLAIYFGFLWTRNLDTNAGFHDIRNVFITYTAGLAIAVVVYNLSLFFQDDDQRSERQIVEAYLDNYLSNHPDTVNRWGLEIPQVGNGIPLADMGREGREHDAEVQSPWGLFAEG